MFLLSGSMTSHGHRVSLRHSVFVIFLLDPLPSNTPTCCVTLQLYAKAAPAPRLAADWER